MDERVCIRMAVFECVRDYGLRLQLQSVWWFNTGCSPAKTLEKYKRTKKKNRRCRKCKKCSFNI